MNVYPVFLCDLEHRRCVVVGATGEAPARIRGLLDCGAQVTVVSPCIDDTLRAACDEGRFSWIARDYRPGDLRGAFLVVAARRDAAIVERIRAEAELERALLNVMDDAGHSSFVAGAVVRRGPLTLAISTSGIAPALAVRLRQRLERELGAEYVELLEMLSGLRARIARQHPDFEARRRVWYALVDGPALDHLKAGRRDEARRELYESAGLLAHGDAEVSSRPGAPE